MVRIKLSIAVIGAGNMAAAHLAVLSKMPEVTVSGIYSRTDDKAIALANKYEIGCVASSVSELFEITKADGVVIAVNEVYTEAVCFEALAHPWRMLVEKPVGLEVMSTERIYAAGADRIFVAMNRRHFSSVTSAQRHLATIEAPRVVQIFDQEDPLTALNAGRPKEVCDQWHFANSIHLIDLFTVFCRGAPLDVQNVIPWRIGYGAKITHSILKFDSGDIAIYHSVWNGPGPWAVIVETPKSRVEMRPLEQLGIQTYPSRRLEMVNLDPVDDDFKPGFWRQMEQFVSALKGDTHSSVPLSSYLNSAILADRLYSTRS